MKNELEKLEEQLWFYTALQSRRMIDKINQKIKELKTNK
jgi:hypothetical protein